MAFWSCCINAFNSKRGRKEQLRVFSLKELSSATDNFNYDNKLGQGLGNVYWGKLLNGSQIAVKRSEVCCNCNKIDKEFEVEIEILGRVQHKNLIGLRGYCVEGRERLIVYDYIPNSSLSFHLHGPQSAECLLDWNRRKNIAIGCAEGIVYLHHQATPRILHRGIKPSSVLLDSDFQALISGFGFSTIIPDGETQVTSDVVKGTMGYLAPEFMPGKKVNESCDVYSFGILLLELASGRKPIADISSTLKIEMVDWALPLVCEKKFSEIVDPRLKGNYVEEEVKRVIIVGLMCAQDLPEKRPTMIDVVELLKGEPKAKFSNKESSKMFRSYIL